MNLMKRWMPKPPPPLMRDERTVRERILATEPRILDTVYGKVLAVSPDGAPIGIGVVADNPEAARAKFAAELVAWADTLERPVHIP